MEVHAEEMDDDDEECKKGSVSWAFLSSGSILQEDELLHGLWEESGGNALSGGFVSSSSWTYGVEECEAEETGAEDDVDEEE